MKKVFKFLLAVSLPFLLVSCNSGSNENNSDNDSTQNPDEDTNTDDTTNNGENSGNGDNVDKTIPTYTGMSVSDTVEKTTVPQGQIRKAASTNYDFYVQAKSTFYIEIHLDNPSQYEILSFTLNDVKYQSYEFNKGSNSELLILEAKAPDTAGNKIFNLSSIKYVDGESIKDVDLSSAKRSIDVGITYAELPSVNIINENVSYTSYDALFDVDAKDIPDFKYECVIYDENNKEVSSFSSGSTTYNLSVKANKLKMNSTYTYEFIGTFDYYDGKGTTEHSFGEGTFTTLDGVKIINESVTSTSFSFEYDIKEPSVKISNVYYEDTVDYSVTKYPDVNSTNISGLKSNRDYNLYVSYTYGEFSGHLEINFKTLAKQPGSYTVSNVTPTANSVSFSLNIDDEDGATNISSITLYDEETGQKVKTLTNTNNLRFTDLYSNHNYRIEVLYYNNLNDGSSNQYSTIIETFTTLANTAPSYSFVLGNTSYTTADISFNENDPNDIGNVESFELYRNDSPVPELTTKTFEEMSEKLKNLYSASKYTLKANYSYDLNEGEGEVDKSIFIEFYTSKYDAPTFNINVENIGFDDVSFSINQSGYEDLISKTLKVVNKETEEVLYTTNEFALNNSIFVNGLNSNSIYEIIIEYSYDLNDSKGVINQTVNSEFTTSKYDEPLVDISLSNSGYDYMDIYISGNSLDLVTYKKLEVINKDNQIVIYTNDNFNFYDYLTISNLYSNSTYEVILTYKYDFHDGKGEIENKVSQEYSTMAYSTPSISTQINSTDYTSMSFYAYYSNNKDLISSVKFEVISVSNNDVVFSQESFNDYDNIYVNDLNSNTNYILRTTYSYNLNDGKGDITTTNDLEFTTPTYQKPEPTFHSSYDADHHNIQFYVDMSSSFLVTSKKIELINKDTEVVEFTNTDFEFGNYVDFHNLNSDTSYIGRLSYTYDLMDGNGPIDDYTDIEFSTQAYNIPTINIEINSSDYDCVNLYITKNEDTTLIKSAKLEIINKNTGAIESTKDSFDFYTVFNVDGLYSNNKYIAKVIYYYDLKDGKGLVEASTTAEFSTYKYDEPIVNVSTSGIGYNTICFFVNYSNFEIITDSVVTVTAKESEEIISSFEVNSNGQKFILNNLDGNTEYIIKVDYTYDYYDGHGLNKGSIETTLNTLNIEDFNFEFDVIPSNTSLGLEIRYENSEDQLIHANNIEVKDLETNEIVKTVDFYDAIYSFGPGYYPIYDLLSNHKYLATFNYSLANYNGVIEKHSFSKEITTLKNYEPYVYLSPSYVGSNFANFYFGVNVSGDTTVEAVNVYLYDNDGNLLQSSNNFVDNPGYNKNYITFTELEPNSSYFAVAEYKYNLKDGNGWSDIKTTEKCKFNTYSNNTYNASLLAIGKDSASISLNSTRETHCNIVLKSAYLCKKDDPENIINKFEFNTKDDQIINLTNLLSNTEYILVYYYDFEYLLNGSIGNLNNLKQTFNFRTNPETLPQINIDYEVVDSSIKYSIDIIKGDEKGIIERVELLDENNFAIYSYGHEAYTGKFDYLESNTKYHIRVTYRYTLNDGNGEYYYSVMENGYATLNGSYVFNDYYYKKIGAIDVIISDNKLYAIFSGKGYSWDDCVKMCEKMGGHLITTNDDNEKAILDELLDSTNNLNSWIGGYYEDDSWHWISGEEFVFNQDNFYYPSTVDPNNGDVLKSWFDVAKYWYVAPTIGSDEQVAYVLELDIGGASNTWIEVL